MRLFYILLFCNWLILIRVTVDPDSVLGILGPQLDTLWTGVWEGRENMNPSRKPMWILGEHEIPR